MTSLPWKVGKLKEVVSVSCRAILWRTKLKSTGPQGSLGFCFLSTSGLPLRPKFLWQNVSCVGEAAGAPLSPGGGREESRKLWV